MARTIPDDAHIAALFLAKYVDAASLLGQDSNAKCIRLFTNLFGMAQSSFKRLRDEYDAFYANRTGYKGAEKRPSRISFYAKYNELSKEDLLASVEYIIEQWASPGGSKNQFAIHNARSLDGINKPNGAISPIKVTVRSIQYLRDPQVVAYVLHRAGGVCETCKKPAPFFRQSDNSPYLEVHHIIPMASGGPDTPENTIALCPNCHREQHYGQSTQQGNAPDAFGAGDL